MASFSEEIEHRLALADAGSSPDLPLAREQAQTAGGPAAMRHGWRTVHGVRLRYADSARSESPTVLLTSPWPESIYAFAPIWELLAQRFRLIAVDLPGFGASSGPAELMSPSAMGAFIVRLIDDWGLERPHVVAPDVGTSAALFAAVRAPEAIASVVVGSGGAAVPIELGSPLREWTLDPDLDRFRALDPRQVIDIALSTVPGHEFPQAIREDYYASYGGERFVESMRYVRRYPDELPMLAEVLGQIVTPVMIFAGLHDRVVPLVNAEFLAQRIPNGRLATLGAGHFVWEEAPAAFAQLLAGWIDEHTTDQGGPA